ncbi:hypothetical protein OGAPHI_002164 [Ogataea philodendri]|uniref:Uridylate kinase n=1 Tax=Ogataea philodendri TaxID=1378263 RepID=A0A9P8PBA3_9ASCO|nr:uncharacterized protein OGAPHI_002164 [Ogataea philodendri]KAH3668410.1 hypothetical protein OGAPHI_002164 [Ogataea philodendri]
MFKLFVPSRRVFVQGPGARARSAALLPVRRAYSSQAGRGKHFYPLLLLGGVALGVTYYNLNNTSKPPKALVEPTGPLYKDSEIDVIFVLGGPGSGKGTQCSRLVKNYDFVHLSAGDLLRAEQANPNSEYGSLIAHYIKEGLIVPQEITINLLKNAVVDNHKNHGKTKFLIDGFPRKMDQAVSFENLVVKSKLVLYFECPEEVMLQRLLERGKTSGRTDDNLESIKKRFRTFVETSMPVVDYFGKQDRVVKVNCNQPVEEVYAKVVSSFNDRGITNK